MTMYRFGDEALLDADWFEESVLRKFKNEQFSLMGKYDEYLTHCYGNYMQLPPESQRVSNHNFAYINLDSTEVIK